MSSFEERYKTNNFGIKAASSEKYKEKEVTNNGSCMKESATKEWGKEIN